MKDLNTLLDRISSVKETLETREKERRRIESIQSSVPDSDMLDRLDENARKCLDVVLSRKDEILAINRLIWRLGDIAKNPEDPYDSLIKYPFNQFSSDHAIFATGCGVILDRISLSDGPGYRFYGAPYSPVWIDLERAIAVNDPRSYNEGKRDDLPSEFSLENWISAFHKREDRTRIVKAHISGYLSKMADVEKIKDVLLESVRSLAVKLDAADKIGDIVDLETCSKAIETLTRVWTEKKADADARRNSEVDRLVATVKSERGRLSDLEKLFQELKKHDLLPARGEFGKEFCMTGSNTGFGLEDSGLYGEKNRTGLVFDIDSGDFLTYKNGESEAIFSDYVRSDLVPVSDDEIRSLCCHNKYILKALRRMADVENLEIRMRSYIDGLTA